MSLLRNPKNWAPYINTKDCSQGFCSIYCPQWCYIIFPPPPPFEFPDEDSKSMFSPLIIAIIGVLASAFLLVSYYAIVTKYCKDRSSGMEEHEVEDMDIIHQAPALHETWHFTANNGLDEALVKLITVVGYKRGDGLVEGTECSVCLSEFEDGERLRLLPKCSHAFHLPCIDMWLKSHSNCPLCRANIISGQPLSVIDENSVQNQSSEPQDENPVMEDIEGPTHEGGNGNIAGNNDALKGPDNPGVNLRDRYGQPVRRSISMGYFGFSLADALLVNQDDEPQQRARISNDALCALRRPISMKRSFSSGIFFATKDATGGSSAMIPF